MEYNEVLFQKVAMPRIKKFAKDRHDVLSVQSMDKDDMAQECRLLVWKELARYTNIKEVEVCKIINTIISTKILNLIREGKEEMNKIEYEEEVPDV